MSDALVHLPRPKKGDIKPDHRRNMFCGVSGRYAIYVHWSQFLIHHADFKWCPDCRRMLADHVASVLWSAS